MNKPTKIWVLLILLPIPLYMSMFVLGLIGLALYWGYYMPYWGLGEPFFEYSTDTGWYYPTMYGKAIAAIGYSLIYWFCYFVFKTIKGKITNNEH